MFNKLFCKHMYKYYNLKLDYSFFYNGYYNVFQFICPKCGKKFEISEYDIEQEYYKLASDYNEKIALGGEPVEISSFSYPRHNNCGVLCESPVATLMIEKYLKHGIDLRQIETYKK